MTWSGTHLEEIVERAATVGVERYDRCPTARRYSETRRVSLSPGLKCESMSNTQFVFLPASLVPSASAVTEAAAKLGFNFEIDWIPRESSSCRCRVGRVEGVVELHHESRASALNDMPELAAEVPESADLCISLVWYSSIHDCACAMVLSAVLSSEFEGVVSFEGDDPVSASELIEQTKEVLEEANASLPEV